jgi:hypothetical protein
MTVADTVRCPWCAEEILAAARKCKHCGEFLTEKTEHTKAGELPGAIRCEWCPERFLIRDPDDVVEKKTSEREIYLHLTNVHGTAPRDARSLARFCFEEAREHSGRIGSREQRGEVDARKVGGDPFAWPNNPVSTLAHLVAAHGWEEGADLEVVEQAHRYAHGLDGRLDLADADHLHAGAAPAMAARTAAASGRTDKDLEAQWEAAIACMAEAEAAGDQAGAAAWDDEADRLYARITGELPPDARDHAGATRALDSTSEGNSNWVSRRWWEYALTALVVLTAVGYLFRDTGNAGTTGRSTDTTVRSCSSLQARHDWLALQAALAGTGNASRSAATAVESELREIEQVMRRQGC